MKYQVTKYTLTRGQFMGKRFTLKQAEERARAVSLDEDAVRVTITGPDDFTGEYKNGKAV